MKKYSLNVLMALFAIGLLIAAHFRFIDSYIQIVAMTIGINIMMSTSLNLVNGRPSWGWRTRGLLWAACTASDTM